MQRKDEVTYYFQTRCRSGGAEFEAKLALRFHLIRLKIGLAQKVLNRQINEFKVTPIRLVYGY